MIEIKDYSACYRDEVIQLVLHCQNDGTRPVKSVSDQPELLHIKEKYLDCSGGFWVATENEKIIGSIGLLNCGNGIGILKKFFVYEAYRGAPHHLGRRLYTTLLNFANQNDFNKLILDTPKNTERAHKFYDKAGFVKIQKSELPFEYDYPYSDSDFFQLILSDAAV